MLTLVSWYLMTPPPNAHVDLSADFQCFPADDPQLSQYLDYPKLDGAPLWQWDTVAVFDNEKDCQEARGVQVQIHLIDQARPHR
jgi:hypothetical protein